MLLFAFASIKTIQVFDLEGAPVLESQPILTTLGIHLQPIIPNKFLTWFTTSVCRSRGESKDPQARIQFARDYGVRWREARLCGDVGSLEECVGRFGTLNDFFTRRIHPELTKAGPEDLTSPAECRLRIVPSQANAFHIKGITYSMNRLLGPAVSWLPTPAAVAICRLTPMDYHRIHAPLDATVVRVEDIVGSYESVDCTVQCSRPVLQENVRRVLCLESSGVGVGRIVMVLIGATCVGSIRTSATVGDHLQKGQDIGDFAFGGSCVVLLTEKPIQWNPRLLHQSADGFETFVRAGTGIGMFDN